MGRDSGQVLLDLLIFQEKIEIGSFTWKLPVFKYGQWILTIILTMWGPNSISVSGWWPTATCQRCWPSILRAASPRLCWRLMVRDGLIPLKGLSALWTLVGKWGFLQNRPELSAKDLRAQHRRSTFLSQLTSEECITPTLGAERTAMVRAMLFPRLSPISEIADRLTIALQCIYSLS